MEQFTAKLLLTNKIKSFIVKLNWQCFLVIIVAVAAAFVVVVVVPQGRHRLYGAKKRKNREKKLFRSLDIELSSALNILLTLYLVLFRVFSLSLL
jgi:hypothetical protein